MMATALLDTNAVSDLMRELASMKARIGVHVGSIATSVVVIGEIRYGLDRLPAGRKRSELETRAKSILAALRVETVTEPIANSYGRLKASLESRGLNLDDNDLWLAATAIAHGNLLVTRDGIFRQIPNLQVEDWSS